MSSNQKTGAEATVDLLAGHGVKHIFGLCGDTSLPLYDALGSLNHGMEHILTRDERHAGYMADAYARVTGKPGVCEGPSGGGATYMLPALIEAGDSSVPILAITTDVATTSVGRFPLTELDQEALFKPVTKWNSLIRSPDVLPRMLRKAFREMTTGRPGSVHLGLPFDVQKAQVNADDIWADEQFSNYPALPQSPNLNSVLEVLAALKTAKTPVIVCGGGVILAGGTAALAVFTEKLDIPVCTTVSGQGSLAETHPNCAGVVGSNGGQAAIRGLVDEADLIFYIGCRAGSVTTERWRSPKAGTTVVHMDNDPAVIGACYQTKAAMVCDARLGLEALISELGAVFGKNGTVRVLAAKTEKWKAFAPLVVSNKMPIKPERVLADLAKHLPDDAVVCADPGTPCPYFSAWFEWRKPGRYFITNRAHGSFNQLI